MLANRVASSHHSRGGVSCVLRRQLGHGDLDLVLEQLHLLRDIQRHAIGDPSREHVGSQFDLALAGALDRDLEQRVDAPDLPSGEELGEQFEQFLARLEDPED